MTDGANSTAAGRPAPATTSGDNGGATAANISSGAGGAGAMVENKVKVIGNYVLTFKTLGKGNFARVEEAQHTATKAKVAVKIINTDKIKEDYVRKNLLREAYIMRRLNHPNIVRLYETMKTRTLYCLVTECAEGGELLLHVKNDHPTKRLSESTARPFIRQLMSALHYMHERGIVHRDLKMENILLDKTKQKIKIVDFGLSNSREPGEFLSTHCGSPEYAAPELFVPGKVYGQEVDVWSLGVNMFAMLAGRLPFRVPRQGPSRRQRLLEQISAGVGPTQEQESSHISPSGMDLVRQLLQPDSVHRPTILTVMRHSWVTKNGLYPLHPYKEDGPDAAQHDRILDLMCARLDVTRRQVSQSVTECRCDWVAAIYHLLHDQPEGQMFLRDSTRHHLAQVLKTGQPARESAADPAAIARAQQQQQLLQQQQQQQQQRQQATAQHSDRGMVHLPAAVPSNATAPPPIGAAVTEAQPTPGHVTTVNAVVKKLEAAAGQPLRTTRTGLRRHDSTSTRPATRDGGLSRRHTFSTQHSRDDQPDGGVPLAKTDSQAGGTSLPSPQLRDPHTHSTSTSMAESAPTSSKHFSTPPIGSPIRSALTNRESMSTTHASATVQQSGHVVSMAQRFGRHPSTPTGEVTYQRRRRESPPKSGFYSSSGQAQASTLSASAEQAPVTPRKKYSFLKTRKTSKDKLSPSKHDKFSSETIPVLSELSEASNRLGANHVSPVGAASLSRSFALKPHAMTQGDQAGSLALHQPLSRSAHLGSTSLSSASAATRGSHRDSHQSFGQQVPSYGRQAGMGAAWTQPTFTAIYNRQSPPSLRRTPSKSRPRSSVPVQNGHPLGQTAFPTSDIEPELPPPIFRVSDTAMGMEDMPHDDDNFLGNTLPSRSRRSGAFGGIFGKALRMKKQK